MRRARVVTVGSVIALAVCAAVAVAQTPAPTVAVTAGPGTVAVQAPGPLAAGPTRFEVTRQGNQDVTVYFFLLNAGVTLDEFKAVVAGEDKTGGTASLGLAWVQGSVAVSRREAKRGVTFALRPGLTYAVMSEVMNQSGNVTKRAITTFTTGSASNGATAAKPDATVRMQGLRFRGASTLPRNGVVRFENRDGVAHIAIAFPLRKGVTSKRFGRALSGSERAIGRVLAGEPSELQGVLGGGNAADAQEVTFAKPGKYGLVCFLFGHERLGMYRVVTVK